MTREQPPVVAPAEVATPPAPVPEPSPPPVAEASPEPVEQAVITRLLADLTVAMADRSGKTWLYYTDAQTGVGAEWAQSGDLETPPVDAGETLHGIGPQGVATWTTVRRNNDVLVRRRGHVAPKRPTLHLMMKLHEPSPRARLEARALMPPAADLEPSTTWVTRKLDQPMVPVGELRGVFGGEVDRIVVFAPVGDVDLQVENPRAEVALLLAGDTPRELLALDGVLEDLQPVAVFDLDGDGVEEVLWLSEFHAEDGAGSLLDVSHFANGQHRVHAVLNRSYSRLSEFGGVRRPGPANAKSPGRDARDRPPGTPLDFR